MKKILLILICIALCFSLLACGADGKDGIDGTPGQDGKDGADGITPIFKVNGSELFVSYNNGESWTSLGNIQGADGANDTNPQGLDFYPKDDGTYVVAVGNAKYLSNITIPATYCGKAVTEIARSGFSSCPNLVNIAIPDSVTSIGENAFNGCSLTSIVIPNSVTEIGYGAFYNCTSLTSVVIGNSVTEIGAFAFYGCTSLTIYCEATSKPAGWNSDWNYSNCPVVWGYEA